MLVCLRHLHRLVSIHLVNTSLTIRLCGLMAEASVELANGDVALQASPRTDGRDCQQWVALRLSANIC